MRFAAAVGIAALLATSCGADRTPEVTGPTDRATAVPATAVPATPTTPPLIDEVAGSSPSAEGTEAQPTVRVLDLPVTPSGAAIACSQAGLVAAALDACLRYEAAGCVLSDDSDACMKARDQLEGVVGFRTFPSDCAELPPDSPAPPPWCEAP